MTDADERLARAIVEVRAVGEAYHEREREKGGSIMTEEPLPGAHWNLSTPGTFQVSPSYPPIVLRIIQADGYEVYIPWGKIKRISSVPEGWAGERAHLRVYYKGEDHFERAPLPETEELLTKLQLWWSQ
jgi:hypothetical protein